VGWVPLLQAVEGVAQHWEVLCRAACLCRGGRGNLRGVHWGQTFACRAPSPTSSRKLQLQIVTKHVCRFSFPHLWEGKLCCLAGPGTEND